MRRTVVASLLIAAIVVSIASGATRARSLRLTIKPRVGHPGTSFVVAFTAPRAGRSSSQITYDIYMASTAGGENFSSPSWMTQGATSFTTPNLPAGRFFVVRAREAAGNEDHNTVERQAKNPCL